MDHLHQTSAIATQEIFVDTLLIGVEDGDSGRISVMPLKKSDLKLIS